MQKIFGVCTNDEDPNHEWVKASCFVTCSLARLENLEQLQHCMTPIPETSMQTPAPTPASCVGNPCAHHGDANSVCTDTGANSFVCACSDGWQGGHSAGCTDIDDCAGNPCDNNGDGPAVCTDTGVYSYTCECSSGWQGGNNTACTDIDDCEGNPCDDNGDDGSRCTDLGAGSFQCTCSIGWTAGSQPDTPCADSDECAGNPCGVRGDTGSICTDSGTGVHTCTCSSGWYWQATSCQELPPKPVWAPFSEPPVPSQASVLIPAAIGAVDPAAVPPVPVPDALSLPADSWQPSALV
eukprot:gene5751-5684_t